MSFANKAKLPARFSQCIYPLYLEIKVITSYILKYPLLSIGVQINKNPTSKKARRSERMLPNQVEQILQIYHVIYF